MPWEFRRPVLACGAESKNTFALAKGTHVFCSQHIGDLKNHETRRAFIDGIAHLSGLLDIAPEVVAYDLHPEYLSTKYALEIPDVELIGVQHHHAHVASCLAEGGDPGPVIGVAFDGTGYGTDGTIWGGEFLLADLTGYRRLAHLAPTPLPGGDAAIRQPWRMATSYLGPSAPPLPVVRRNERRWRDVARLAERGVTAPMTSSAGRLFDAVAAILDIRDTVTYEGQAAIELEQRSDPHTRGTYPVVIDDGEPLQWCGRTVVNSAVDDLLSGTDTAVIAARFHNTVAKAICLVCRMLRERTGIEKVGLTGGVFQNQLLVNRTVDLLADSGFTVLTHSHVPCNDGGISLGQAAVAGATDRKHCRRRPHGGTQGARHHPATTLMPPPRSAAYADSMPPSSIEITEPFSLALTRLPITA